MGIDPTWEVVVVGSGPAGAMAAYELSKAGLKVEVSGSMLTVVTRSAT